LLFPGSEFTDAVESTDEFWSEFLQLAGVGFGESFESAFSRRRQFENDEAMIGVGLKALDKAGIGAALAEFDDAVMAEAETFGDPGDGGFDAVWRTGDLQHELMLLGLEACFVGGLFAEEEEFAQGVTEFG
jgi:hypothetical protein